MNRAFHFTHNVLPRIQIEKTPNPNSLKFLSPATSPSQYDIACQNVNYDSLDYSQITREINSYQQAEDISLPASKIWSLYSHKIQNLLVSPSFITVNKKPDVDWSELSELTNILEREIERDQPFLQLDKIEENFSDEKHKEIENLIENKVRPVIQEDGGDLLFLGYHYDEGIVDVRLQGSCVGCSFSEETLFQGVERILHYYLPEIKKVRPIENTQLDKVNYQEFQELEKRL